MVPSVTAVATKIVFANDRAQRVFGKFQASTQFSGCHTAGQKVGGYDCASRKDLKDVVIIQ